MPSPFRLIAVAAAVLSHTTTCASLPHASSQCADDTEVFFADTGCVSLSSAYSSAYSFLTANLPSWDKANAASLGFSLSPDTADGLDDGIATVGLNISLVAQQTFPWAWDLPQSVFNEYVATFAHVNEARNNWRPVLSAATAQILANAETAPTTVADVVTLINSNLWHVETSGLVNNITFKSSQTPLIYDPMSTLVFGYASCTGVSILFADALRTVGVAARVAGTPAWNGELENGNHNWIEVYIPEDDEWAFLEAAPAGGGETLSNPCDKWFCSPAKMANGTEFFSTRFDASSETVYPMAWDLDNDEVPGVDRTDYYQTTCNQC
mmetsp:Transcript_19852/g.39733  ORF Transcript_19852/g.39733 Transcript_19852/m.39733 type:complete len:324 (-) Transcript_19852:73-1044(-)